MTSARRTRASGGVVTSTPGLDELDLAVPDPSLDASAVKSIKSPSSSFTRQIPSRLDCDRPVMVAYNALAPSTSPHRAYPSMNAPNVFRSGVNPDSIIASTCPNASANKPFRQSASTRQLKAVASVRTPGSFRISPMSHLAATTSPSLPKCLSSVVYVTTSGLCPAATRAPRTPMVASVGSPFFMHASMRVL